MSPAVRTNALRCQQLLAVLAGGRSLLIVLQDSPDPDALAAAAALRFIANQKADMTCTLAHGGVIGRAENLALVRYLGLSLRSGEGLDVTRFDRIAMVDTQPGTGNNALPAEVVPHLVIDHHPMRQATRRATFTDVRRRYGATSTILAEYLQCLGLTPDRPLATALVYGIRSDTQELGREACRADIEASLALRHLASPRMLGRIQHAAVPREYFTVLARALHRAVVAGPGVFCALGRSDNPDMIAEIADLLLRYDACEAVLVCGLHAGGLRLSLRLRPGTELDAGKTVRRLVAREGTGGGHATAAGGQIPAAASRHAALVRRLRQRFRRLAALGPAPFAPLVARHAVAPGAQP